MADIACRKGEALEDAARRVATDALYAARDRGGTMHDAGAAAGDVVSSLYAAAVETLQCIADEPCEDGDWRQLALRFQASARETLTSIRKAA